jgi:hypothetical protein
VPRRAHRKAGDRCDRGLRPNQSGFENRHRFKARFYKAKTQALRKLKHSKRAENDILDFDFTIECASEVDT